MNPVNCCQLIWFRIFDTSQTKLNLIHCTHSIIIRSQIKRINDMKSNNKRTHRNRLLHRCIENLIYRVFGARFNYHILLKFIAHFKSCLAAILFSLHQFVKVVLWQITSIFKPVCMLSFSRETQ